MNEAEKALEKILFNLYEMGHINKQRIKDGFLTDEEEMAYQRTLIFETITAIKNIFVEFDEDTTRKQIADIITFYRTLVNGWAETGAGADDLPETALKESVDAIFSLITGETK